MKKFWLLVIVLSLAGYYQLHKTHFDRVDTASAITGQIQSDNASLISAIESRARDVEVQGTGLVVRILPDDTEGNKHQRFIVRLNSGSTVLIAHNIDLAPRVQGLNVGDNVAFKGEYIWNDKGGVIHWTHHDPHGHHEEGWIDHDGQRAQ